MSVPGVGCGFNIARLLVRECREPGGLTIVAVGAVAKRRCPLGWKAERVLGGSPPAPFLAEHRGLRPPRTQARPPEVVEAGRRAGVLLGAWSPPCFHEQPFPTPPLSLLLDGSAHGPRGGP